MAPNLYKALTLRKDAISAHGFVYYYFPVRPWVSVMSIYQYRQGELAAKNQEEFNGILCRVSQNVRYVKIFIR